MQKIKNFFTLVKYEIIKLSRNKLLFVFLLLFPILMTIGLNSFQINEAVTSGNNSSEEITYEEAMQSLEKDEVLASIFIEGNLQDNPEIINTIDKFYGFNHLAKAETQEEGENMLKRGEVYFYIYLNVENQPAHAEFYYDSAPYYSPIMINNLRKKQLEITYNSVIEYLDSYGITLNEEYFNTVEFTPIQEQKVTYKQRMLGIGSTFIAIVVMFGLSYSMSRDNETSVIKQVAYTPISPNKYLLSKALPLVVLAFVQSIILLGMGFLFYDLTLQSSFFVVVSTYLLFVLASAGLGLVFSSLKNQTTATFATMISILFPLVAIYIGSTSAFPALIEWLFYILPLTPFMELFNMQVFTGVTVSKYILALVIQIFSYYLIAYFMAKKKAGLKLFK